MEKKKSNYIQLQPYDDRLKEIVDISYKLLCHKIVNENISIQNEASMQMQLGVILKQVGQLYEFSLKDRFSVELETWQDITPTSKSTKGRARCDISLKITNGEETSEAAIELKYFKYSSTNEAVTDNRFSLLLDLKNLEQYKYKNNKLLCYEIVFTDNENYTKADNRSKIKITPTISGYIKTNTTAKNYDTIELNNTYSSKWDSYSKKHHFLKIDLQNPVENK